jgi:tetratricopeptide (TPR) repeat protein
MTEDIITDLSKIESIRVASRNAVLPYKDKPVDVQELGKNLSLDAVLQGSFRKSNNRIRISAQLVDAQEGFNLWAERYDRELTEVFVLQEEIAKSIAAALKIKLSDQDAEKIALKYKNNLEAYDLYLKGRNYFYKYTKKDLLIAILMFEKALKVDPQYALAYAGLADSYVQMIDRYYETDKGILGKAEEAAQKALAIDPLCAEAYKSLGLVYYKEWRLRKAKEQFLKALELKPGFSAARSNLASTYVYLGDFERAEREYRTAYEEDPSLTFVLWLTARLYLSLNRFAEAESCVQKVMATGESSFHLEIGYYLLTRIYFYQGQFEQALGYLQKYVEVEPNEPFGDSALASLYAALAQPEKARAKIADTLKSAPWDEDIIENLILAFWFLGDRESFYDWIRKGTAENKIVWVFLEGNPLLENARGEPVFQELLRELKTKTLGATT